MEYSNRIVLLFVVLLLFSQCSLGARLITDTYIVEVEVNCPEGNVTCDNVTMTVFNKSDGSFKEKASGKTFHTKCKDGTPCRFLGYIFVNGANTFRVFENGNFEVIIDTNKLVHSEKGTWE